MEQTYINQEVPNGFNRLMVFQQNHENFTDLGHFTGKFDALFEQKLKDWPGLM